MRYMLFDRWGNPLGDLPYAIKAIRTRATDGTDTLDITTIGEINKDERIVFKDSMGRWAEYLCQSTQTARAAGMPVTVAYCTGSIAELSRTYIEDKRNRNANAKACLAKALEGAGGLALLQMRLQALEDLHVTEQLLVCLRSLAGTVETAFEIGRASCRERVSSPV